MKFFRCIFRAIFYTLLVLVGSIICPFILTLGMLFLITALLYEYCKLMIIKKHIRKRLKPIVKEAMQFYNINITENEHIIFYKNNNLVSVPIPNKKKLLDKAISTFKEKSGSIDSPIFFENRNSWSAITNIKKEKKNVFFSPLYKDKHFLENVHLYDLSSLDGNELRSILSMNLSDYQKLIIYNKYCKELHINSNAYI